jgi:hypothetical protein
MIRFRILYYSVYIKKEKVEKKKKKKIYKTCVWNELFVNFSFREC